MKRRFFIAAMILALVVPAWAGDYWLTIADDPDSACAKPGHERTASWPVVSSSAVAEDVARYFAGQRTAIGLFPAAFGNARVTFCGTRERAAVYEALVNVALAGARANQRHLYDFAMMLGSKQLIEIIDRHLQDKDISQQTAERLRRMRTAADQGMKFRHQGSA